MRVGTVVRLRLPVLGNPKGSLGVCYEAYSPTGYCASKQHFSFIFANGNYDGFSTIEQEDFLIFVRESDLVYNFTNVIKLSEDFRRGVFSPYLKGV